MQISIKVYARVLKGCITLKALSDGKQAHAEIQKNGLDSNVFLGGILIDMYAKCGSLPDAHLVFDKMPEHNVYSWTAIIAAYSKQHEGEKVMELYVRMKKSGVAPDRFVYLYIVKACASLASLEQGREVHAQVIESNIATDVLIENALIDMYAKCGSMLDTWSMFNRAHAPDVVSWNIAIAGFCQQGLHKEALRLFDRMQHECMMPDDVTLISVLKACVSIAASMLGKKIHLLILASSLLANVITSNALLDMYAKCGTTEDAHLFFNDMPIKDVISWTVLITCYAQQRLCIKALILFLKMQQSGMIPSSITLISILKAFASQGSLELGRQIYAYVLETGLHLDILTTSALLDMYAKCGEIEDAEEVFSKMHKRSVVPWTVMIIAYAQQGPEQQALTLFQQMHWEGMMPSNVTFVGILKVCANLAAVEMGKQVHDQILNGDFESNLFLGNTLIDMYAKCGSMKDAHEVFNCMHDVNIVSWNVIIIGYAQHGLGKKALSLFKQMIVFGRLPNEATFKAVLYACNHQGLLDEGLHQFVLMINEHRISPSEEHCACMVDLLGRAGCLDQAYEFTTRIPLQPDAVVWIALLSSCKIHDNAKLGRTVSEFVFEMQPNNPAGHVLLSNIFSVASKWDEHVNIVDWPKMWG